MRMISRPILIVAAGVILQQCSTTQPYPEDWSPPAAVVVGECPDISGTFSNACTPNTDHDDDCLETGGLAGLLLAEYAGSFHSELGSADRVVVLRPSSSRLLVRAWNVQEVVRETEIHLSADDCTEDGILVRSGGKGTQIEGGVGVGSSRAVLNKNEDGDLIARLQVNFTGVWFIVPVSGSSQNWRLFEALSVPVGEP